VVIFSVGVDINADNKSSLWVVVVAAVRHARVHVTL
jgi:hypothetical protein